MWHGNYFQGKKVKGQGHQAALRTAALTHQPVAAVTVRMYWPWEPTATLRSAGSVGSAARGASAPTEGGEGRGILWRPPTYSLLNGNSMRTNSKKRSEATQTLHAGYSKAEPKKFRPAADPLPEGAWPPKFNQLGMVTTFTYRPSLVKIDAHNFELSSVCLSVCNRPTKHKHTNKPQTGPITIHCAAKLSTQCNENQLIQQMKTIVFVTILFCCRVIFSFWAHAEYLRIVSCISDNITTNSEFRRRLLCMLASVAAMQIAGEL